MEARRYPRQRNGIETRSRSKFYTGGCDCVVMKFTFPDEHKQEISLTLYHTIPTLTILRKKALENTVGKGENAGNQHFLLFPQCFLPYQENTVGKGENAGNQHFLLFPQRFLPYQEIII